MLLTDDISWLKEDCAEREKVQLQSFNIAPESFTRRVGESRATAASTVYQQSASSSHDVPLDARSQAKYFPVYSSNPAQGESDPTMELLTEAKRAMPTSVTSKQLAPMPSDLVHACPSGEASEGTVSLLPSAFQMEFIRRMIREEMECFRDDMKRNFFNLHLDMLNQFQLQQVTYLQLTVTYLTVYLKKQFQIL